MRERQAGVTIVYDWRATLLPTLMVLGIIALREAAGGRVPVLGALVLLGVALLLAVWLFVSRPGRATRGRRPTDPGRAH